MSKLGRLIEDVYRKGESSEEGLTAIKTLATMGQPALRAMIASMANPPSSDLHPIDLWESIHRVFWEFARVVPDPVIDFMEAGALSPAYGYGALGGARGRRSIDVLIGGLKHKDPLVRWIAAEALVQRRVKRAVPTLLQALRDRSDSVKRTVVFAMQTQGMYRRPEALPALRRILKNERIRTSSPGTWKAAADLIRRIKAST